jgi:predicted tellurium resistance membrane protein TerC
VPIVVYGSTMVLKLVERFPVIIKIGAAVLAFTAANMIVGEQLLDPLYGDAKDFASTEISHLAAKWATYAISIAGVLGFGWWAGRRNSSNQDTNLASR